MDVLEESRRNIKTRIAELRSELGELEKAHVALSPDSLSKTNGSTRRPRRTAAKKQQRRTRQEKVTAQRRNGSKVDREAQFKAMVAEFPTIKPKDGALKMGVSDSHYHGIRKRLVDKGEIVVNRDKSIRVVKPALRVAS